MNHSYLDAARIGKASHWRYLGGTLWILFAYVGLGFILILALSRLFFPDVPLEDIADPLKAGSLPAQAILLAGFIPFFIACLIVSPWIHKRPWLAVITVNTKINWERIALGFGLWFGIIALLTIADALLMHDPKDFTFSFDPNTFYFALVLSLLLISIQAATEELFFRGYLMQWFSLLNRNRLWLSFISGGAFVIPHFANPETIHYPIPYMLGIFLIGFLLGWISVHEGTL
ncbi:MAG: CPBP family intramembrane glutamic endopeptidase, partial [Candidatus Zixiibacteriota bacterium]